MVIKLYESVGDEDLIYTNCGSSQCIVQWVKNS